MILDTKMTTIRSFLCCAVVVWSLHSVLIQAATMQQVNDLSAKLLYGYNKNTLPIIDQDSELNVNSFIELLVITDLNELEEVLSTVMVLHLLWVDESMSWNRNEHYNITFVTMEARDMWKPHLAVTNAHVSKKTTDDNDWHLIQYLFTGEAEWVTMKTLETSCDMDTTYYPFDIQVCSIELYIYGYYGKIRFNPLHFNTTHLYMYKPHSTWTIMKYDVVSPVGSNITITYHLKRNPKYMVINFLVPLFVLALLNPLVFLLPADSGERSGYSISIMLALSVFLTQLAYYLPQNSDPIPLITYTIMIWYVMSAFSLVFLFMSARLFNKNDKKPVPKAIQLFVKCVRRLFCQECGNQIPKSSDITTNRKGSKKIYEEQQLALREADDGEVMNSTDGVKPISWKQVSRSFDLLFMVLIYIVKFIFAFVFMLLISTRETIS